MTLLYAVSPAIATKTIALATHSLAPLELLSSNAFHVLACIALFMVACLTFGDGAGRMVEDVYAFDGIRPEPAPVEGA